MSQSLNPQKVYRNFLQQHFEGLLLKSPLFYGWKYGLRFDLQPDTESKISPPQDDYFDFVQQRAFKLYESCFSAQDEIMLIFRRLKWNKRCKIRRHSFGFRQVSGLQAKELAFGTFIDLEDPRTIYRQALIHASAGRLNHRNLLAALSHTDFPPRKPYWWLNTFLLNLSNPLIFYMYDDRGLDIIAPDRSSLRPLYDQHRDWILDYDRKKIEKMMGA